LSTQQNNELVCSEVFIKSSDSIDVAKGIIKAGTHVLICGAISWPLELMLVSTGIMVIPNTCGLVNDVIAAFITGNLTEQAFLMPGCTGKRRHRMYRHRNGKKK
jgi:predicted Fe-Mo cluster-binding NifX family protein